jgi:hypothetical protein
LLPARDIRWGGRVAEVIHGLVCDSGIDLLREIDAASMPRSGENKQAAEDTHRPASTDPCVAAVARPVRGDANPAEHTHEFAAKV